MARGTAIKAVALAWPIGMLMIQSALAEMGHFVGNPDQAKVKIEGIRWEYRFTVDQEGIHLKGANSRPDWTISLGGQPARIGSVSGKAGQVITFAVPIKDKITHIRLYAVSLNGQVQMQDFDIQIDDYEAGPARSFWDLRGILGGQLSNLSENYLSAVTSTSGAWGIPRAGLEVSFWRAKSLNSKAWEFRGSAHANTVLSNSGLGWPIEWDVAVGMLRRNGRNATALGQALRISVLAQTRLEMFSLASPNYASPVVFGGSDLNFQNRNVLNFWMDLGLRLRMESATHPLEVSPTISFSPWSRSTLTNGTSDSDGLGYGGALEVGWGLTAHFFVDAKSALFKFPGTNVGISGWRNFLGLGYKL